MYTSTRSNTCDNCTYVASPGLISGNIHHASATTCMLGNATLLFITSV